MTLAEVQLLSKMLPSAGDRQKKVSKSHACAFLIKRRDNSVQCRGILRSPHHSDILGDGMLHS